MSNSIDLTSSVMLISAAVRLNPCNYCVVFSGFLQVGIGYLLLCKKVSVKAGQD
jgi:hypothetical protein